MVKKKVAEKSGVKSGVKSGNGSGDQQFSAEVGRLLELMASALYSDRQVFLRELISNAADACDRLRYDGLQNPDLLGGDVDFGITLSSDKALGVLVIEDNGCGMSRAELSDNLGTIARSGTAQFAAGLGDEARSSSHVIGQFGVGFYSSFMVADSVEVYSRKAGESGVHVWVSSGKGGYSVDVSDELLERGTRIVLHLREDSAEFLEEVRLHHIIGTYAEHITVPVFWRDVGGEVRQLNSATALWSRVKGDVSEGEYDDFYKQLSHSVDSAWQVMHFHREGTIQYSALLYIPLSASMDLFHPDRRSQLRLYVQRVFITDDCQELIPSWLRFLRGVIDCQDLPLNISREMLQNNPVLRQVRSGLVSHVLKVLSDLVVSDVVAYDNFWVSFGAILKEGIYEDISMRDDLLPLLRVYSLRDGCLLGLEDYVRGMCVGQKEIYYITGGDLELLRRSPQLESFRKRGIDVLLMTDPVDEFWLPVLGKYGDYEFRSVARGLVDLSEVGDVGAGKTSVGDKNAKGGKGGKSAKVDDGGVDISMDKFLEYLRRVLGDSVSDVRLSSRLDSSAVCLVADEGEMSLYMRRMLQSQGQVVPESAPILEVNGGHSLICLLAGRVDVGGLGDEVGYFLLEQARLLEGEGVRDVHLFSERLCGLLERAFRE